MSPIAMNHTPLRNMTMVDNSSKASAVGFSRPSSSTKYMRSNGNRHDLRGENVHTKMRRANKQTCCLWKINKRTCVCVLEYVYVCVYARARVCVQFQHVTISDREGRRETQLWSPPPCNSCKQRERYKGKSPPPHPSPLSHPPSSTSARSSCLVICDEQQTCCIESQSRPRANS